MHKYLLVLLEPGIHCAKGDFDQARKFITGESCSGQRRPSGPDYDVIDCAVGILVFEVQIFRGQVALEKKISRVRGFLPTAG